jgi:hypothetical protein
LHFISDRREYGADLDGVALSPILVGTGTDEASFEDEALRALSINRLLLFDALGTVASGSVDVVACSQGDPLLDIDLAGGRARPTLCDG